MILGSDDDEELKIMAYSEKSRAGVRCYFLFICMIVMTAVIVIGCDHYNGGFLAKSGYEEANQFSSLGNYAASLQKYAEIMEKYPSERDRALFEMGVIHADPRNNKQNYQKSQECFDEIIRAHPASGYRQDSETMMSYINSIAKTDEMAGVQQALVEKLQRELRKKDDEIVSLLGKVGELERKIVEFTIQGKSADKILVEKRNRRLTLMSKGEVLKTYRIALGGDPDGPKERQGDNKTPEGTYIIDSRNRDSRYHLSLHISYPNETDKKRAKKLGVDPGGNIMIHGIKEGFSWVDGFHSRRDWTQGCIAVTDEEIEEIDKLAPNGTVVEIRP